MPGDFMKPRRSRSRSPPVSYSPHHFDDPRFAGRQPPAGEFKKFDEREAANKYHHRPGHRASPEPGFDPAAMERRQYEAAGRDRERPPRPYDYGSSNREGGHRDRDRDHGRERDRFRDRERPREREREREKPRDREHRNRSRSYERR